MADYTPQDMRNLILKFFPGSYTPQTFENVVLNFELRPSYEGSGNLQAAITGMGLYQDTTYTYLKYCERFVIGYGIYGVQILTGRCYYGGIRDLGASIQSWEKITYSETKDLPASISQIDTGSLPAEIGVHSPADLLAYVNTFQTDTIDLPALIHGWQEKDLSAYINMLMSESLPASIGGETAPDLPAYLKVWPMKQLPASIYGWGQSDLSAYIYSIQQGNLPAVIGIEAPIDLGVILRAWAREVPKDLGAYIRGFAYKDLPGIIRVTYLEDLPAYLYCIQPRDLSASIYGYGLTNLPAYLNGVYGPYDLRASINITNNYKDLSAYLDPNTGVREPSDLFAYVRGWNATNLGSYVYAIACSNLSAYLNTQGYVGDLSASIYPKTIRLTSVISIITMEHLDLSAVVNPSCIWSESRNLTAYLRQVYKSDLAATLLGKRYDTGVGNLYGKVGYADTYSFIDKLPVNISIATGSYRFVEKFPISFRFFADTRDIAASITGTYLYEDMPASISGVYLDPHHFANVKNKQKVYKLSASGIAEWFEMVELSFKSIVKDYHYSTSGDSAWKVDRLDRWILDVSSYIPVNIKLETKRKFHKLKYVYDLTRFDSIDEAVRYAIDFVTDYPEVDFPASIYASGGYRNMQGILNVRRTVQENYDLAVSIAGQDMGDVIIGIDGDGIDVL